MWGDNHKQLLGFVLGQYGWLRLLWQMKFFSPINNAFNYLTKKDPTGCFKFWWMMDGLANLHPFNTISVISGWWKSNYLGSKLWSTIWAWKTISLAAGFKPATLCTEICSTSCSTMQMVLKSIISYSLLNQEQTKWQTENLMHMSCLFTYLIRKRR